MSSDSNSSASSAVSNGDASAEREKSLQRLSMSSESHSPDPSSVSMSADVEEAIRRLSVSNGNVSVEEKKPLRRLSASSAKYSPASSAAVSYGNAWADEEKKPLPRLNVPRANRSPASSSLFYGNVPAEEMMPAWGRPLHEAIEAAPPIIGGSVMLPTLSDYNLWLSPQWSYSGDVLQRPPIPHYFNTSTNGEPLLRSANTPPPWLGYPNGPAPYYREETSKGNYNRGVNRRQGGYGYRYDQDRGYERMPNYHPSLNGMVPRMPLPRLQPPPYLPPLIQPSLYSMPFVGNPLPSTWSACPAPIGITYVPVDVPHYPAQPHAQYFSGPTSVPRQEINAAQKSPSPSLDDLRARLRKQIEYYFSSENLVTDHYLKTHMDYQGWVSVNVIVPFRKVQQLLVEKQNELDSLKSSNGILVVQDKSLTDNEQFILDSLRPSEVVEVQSDKMRKRHEWERWIHIAPRAA